MSQLENLNIKERDAIEELRARVKDHAPHHIYEDTLLFYRFLKARDFELNKAESMLRKHMKWRKIHQVDTILEDFQPSPIFLKYIHGTYLGEDKEGCPIQYVPGGRIETKDVTKSFKDNRYFRHYIWTVENLCAKVRETSLKTGKNASKFTYIIDFNGLQLANATNPTTAAHYMQIAQMYQDNYPERLKSFYLINAPTFYVITYSIIKRILAAEVIRKISVYGRTGWQEELLNVIDADVLPAFLGGNKADHDGNPMCNTLVYHGGRIPSEYFLSKEDRTFKDMSQVKKITIPAGRAFEVSVEAEKFGMFIKWEYEVDNKDIGFGLYFQESETERIELLPINRVDTSDGTENGSYRCEKTGKYIFVFDNTFSWITTKQVSYYITVAEFLK